MADIPLYCHQYEDTEDGQKTLKRRHNSSLSVFY
jgi:hypothetical protein